MYSKYIKDLLHDFRNLNQSSFIDKHGYSSILKANRLNNEQNNIERVDAQIKRATANARKVY
jgi:hypothetical protein